MISCRFQAVLLHLRKVLFLELLFNLGIADVPAIFPCAAYTSLPRHHYHVVSIIGNPITVRPVSIHTYKK